MLVETIVDGCPDLLGLYNHAPAHFAALLQSASKGTPQARFDLLLIADQQQAPIVKYHPAARARQNHCDNTQAYELTEHFLATLDAVFQQTRVRFDAANPWPFVGGYFVYCGYELVSEIEPSLTLPQSEAPIAYLVRCPAAIIVDHQAQRCVSVREASYPMAAELLQQWRQVLSQPTSPPTELSAQLTVVEDPAEQYLTQVDQALEHIRAGNIYQANLSRQWRIQSERPLDGAQLYQKLRQANPGPFAAIARLPGGEVLSTSPERLFRVQGQRIDTRPIAGTRPRTGDEQAMRAELLNNPKEIAEHVMLIDLERNDLGKICEAGSVVVDEWMSIESYTSVHHLVSNVTGQLRPTVTPADIIRALFPGGTITGVPKVRCMSIIGQLEATAREAYTGSLGYLSLDGQMDLNILIRTAWLTEANRTLSIRAGAGVVADSAAERELMETRAKARGLLRGLGLLEMAD